MHVYICTVNLTSFCPYVNVYVQDPTTQIQVKTMNSRPAGIALDVQQELWLSVDRYDPIQKGEQ